MVKTILKQMGKRFNSVYMASHFYLKIWTCWNTELQRVQVAEPASILCVIAEKMSAFLPGSLFSTCLDCFMIFSPTRHECVIVFLLNASAPLHRLLFYVLP